MTVSFALNEAHLVVPTPNTKPVKQALRKRNYASKQVKFLPYVTAYLDTAEEYIVVDRWYSRKDYAHFKSQIARDSDSFKALYPKSARALKQVMKACQRASARGVNSFHTELSKVLKPQLQDFLQQCIQDAPNLIGVHKQFVDYLAQDKMARRSKMLDAVLRTQSAPWCSTGSGVVPEGICQNISCPSSLFAQVIGHVAAKAA